VAYSENSIEGRLLQNDPEALGQVLRWITAVLTWPRFWSLREEWPDLVQETLTRVVESLRRSRFDAERDFYFYVQGVARHTALHALEAASRRTGKEGPALPEEILASPGATAGESVPMRQLLRRVMDDASEDCRFLMRVYYLEEKSYGEIATELALPVGTVKSRLFRCLESARRALRTVVRRSTDAAAD